MPSVQFPYDPELTWDGWINRFPEWCHGYEQWKRQLPGDGQWIEPELPTPLPLYDRIMGFHRNPPRPRIFISHRQGDEEYAKRIAYLADQIGFEYWLDVVNLPPPKVIAAMSAKSVAMRIEMALLNCSHIVAVYTDITPGSTWVPYEYGRVKEPVLTSTKCCTWLYIQKNTTRKPEWIELNEKREHEQPLIQWLNNEANNWPFPFTGPANQWSGHTKPLP